MSQDAPLLTALDDRFELKERLGAGGMGEVYRAWDRLLQRAVALKFPKGGGPRTLERLLMEARLQSSVEHPNIGKVYEVGALDGRPCIALQLIEGPSLDLIGAQLSVEERVRLVRQVADALHTAHLQGLLHRDVKPANILVEGDREGSRKAYVTDFGLARNEEGGLSQAGQGTFLYMSPEQVSAVGLLDARSDVYSLGATLYALLVDHPPFGESTVSGRPTEALSTESVAARFYGLFPEEGEGSDPVETYRRMMEEDPTPPRRLRPELPQALDTIVTKCLAKSPSDRYASAKELSEDLDRFLNGEPLHAQVPTWMDRTAHWARRNPVAFRSAILGAASLVLGGGVAMWTQSRARQEASVLAQLGAEAKEMDTLLRMEYLEPAHDLRPAFQQLRDMMTAIAARKTDLGRGAAAFAMGKGHQWLGAWEASHRAFDDAQRLGVKGPDWEEAMGLVLGRLYERELQRTKDIPAGDRKLAAVAALQKEYRDPAVKHLAAAAQAKPGAADLLTGYVALYESRYEEGLAAAVRAKAGRPGLYEASLLEGELRLAEQFTHEQAGRLEQSLTAADRVEAALEEALRVGRSDPKAWILLARSRELRLAVLTNQAKPTHQWVEEALKAAKQALALNPALHEAWLAHGRVLVEEARFLQSKGQDPLPIFREAVDDLQKSADLAEDPRTAKEEMAWVCTHLVGALQQRGLKAESEQVLTRGVSAARAVLIQDAQSLPAEKRLAYLLFQRGEGAAMEGKDPLPDYLEAVKHGEAALALDPKALGPHVVLSTILVRQARYEGEQGKDPEPVFQKAAVEVAGALKQSPDNVQTLGAVIWVHRAWGANLQARGKDAQDALRPAIDAAETLIKRDPRNPSSLALAADLYAVSAWTEAAMGRDPHPALDACRSHGTKALWMQRNLSSVHDALARSYLVEAEAQWKQKRSPLASLAHLRSEIAAALRANAQMPFTGIRLAEGAVLEAEWRLSKGDSIASLVRRSEVELAPYTGEASVNASAFLLRGSLRALLAQQLQGEGRARLRDQAEADLRKVESRALGSPELEGLKRRLKAIG